MIDTHSHLDFSHFDNDRETVIKKFLASGGKWLLNVGVNTEQNQKSLVLVEKYERIFCSLGYHPEELAKRSLSELLLEAEKFLLEKGRNKKVMAIGETGLDYFHNKQNKNDQKKLFNKQMEIASVLNLPVILHCRDAYEDIFEMISKFKNLKFVLHCYSGNLEQTEKFLQLSGVHFSFTGNITFLKKKDAEIFSVIRKISLDKIMVETDCPFLAPNPFRGKRNEPSYVKLIIEKLAEIRGLDFKEMEKITDQNAADFFDCKI